MIGNLESQEFMNSVQRGFAVSGNRDLRATRCFLEFPMKLAFQLRHDGGSWDVLRVNQHGHIEISSREHLHDVMKMGTNLIAGLGIVQIVCANLDNPHPLDLAQSDVLSSHARSP